MNKETDLSVWLAKGDKKAFSFSLQSSLQLNCSEACSVTAAGRNRRWEKMQWKERKNPPSSFVYRHPYLYSYLRVRSLANALQMILCRYAEKKEIIRPMLATATSIVVHPIVNGRRLLPIQLSIVYDRANLRAYFMHFQIIKCCSYLLVQYVRTSRRPVNLAG